ncbi:MAG: tRNA 2-thiouridine(34) synthase MnmA [Candidatus Marinimicrobia bacterium]|nr:tRNA 2-thiouridine(34) synthase MnmA [Candidatus Neomarinimicrobiota bacterium]
MKKNVLVAMSGGVDSSVAMHKVIRAGHNAVGVTMKLWDNKDPKTNMVKPSLCNSSDAINGAKLVCDRLGVKHYTINFMDLFKKHVINDFANQYMNGKTPNPCVKCNSIIKWDALMNFASEIGFEYIATGHYAQIEEEKGTYMIKKGHDKLKDQSYMLWDIDKSQLSKTIFPIGSLTKDEVREYAVKYNLETANRNESQDLCFVLDNDYNQFLNEIAPEKMRSIKDGPIEDEKGTIVGQHAGFTKYTIGQRKGLGLSYPEPRYVKKINPINNTLTVGTKQSLFSKKCVAHEINFFVKNINFPIEVDAKIRYNSKSSSAIIEKGNKELIIKFVEPQLAITPGQSIVFYNGEQMIGGAIIK